MPQRILTRLASIVCDAVKLRCNGNSRLIRGHRSISEFLCPASPFSERTAAKPPLEERSIHIRKPLGILNRGIARASIRSGMAALDLCADRRRECTVGIRPVIAGKSEWSAI
jgi:hypothetical protein